MKGIKVYRYRAKYIDRCVPDFLRALRDLKTGESAQIDESTTTGEKMIFTNSVRHLKGDR